LRPSRLPALLAVLPVCRAPAAGRIVDPGARDPMTTLAGYRRAPPGAQPPYLLPPYRSSVKRAPQQPLGHLPPTLSGVTGPVLGAEVADPRASDLTRGHGGPALGERIAVGGRVLDEDGRPLRGRLVEGWQGWGAGRVLPPAR